MRTRLSLGALVLLALSLGVTWTAPRPAAAAGVVAVAAGAVHTCALTGEGTVKCWGGGPSGQRGDGTTDLRRYEPVDVCADAACITPLSGVARITAGNTHTCALMEGGGVKCWGSSNQGQLGNGELGEDTAHAVPYPVDVCADEACATPLSGVISVVAGNYHTCALTSDRAVKCWGSNTTGQLGDGQRCGAECPTPTAVCADAACGEPLRGVAGLAAGWLFSCALMLDGGVKCWGDNTVGELGDGTGGFIFDGPLPDLRFRTTPDDVCQTYDEAAEVCTETFSGGSGITAGTQHTCAIVAAGEVRCWGWNGGALLGDVFACTDRSRPSPTYFCPTPVVVCQLFDEVEQLCLERFSGATALTAGLDYTCAIAGGSRVMCWGESFNGGGCGGSGCYTPEPRLTGIVVEAGSNHTCAVPTTGGLMCWGANFYGELGAGICCNDSQVLLNVVGFGAKPTPTMTPTSTPTQLPPTDTPVPSAAATARTTPTFPDVSALPQSGRRDPPASGGLILVLLAGISVCLAAAAFRCARRKERSP
ncbi:MAG: hypothetical protein WEE64_15520 [Dehalococcoidia bacterium]